MKTLFRFITCDENNNLVVVNVKCDGVMASIGISSIDTDVEPNFREYKGRIA